MAGTLISSGNGCVLMRITATTLSLRSYGSVVAWPAIYHPPSECTRNLVLSMSGAASSSAIRLEDQLTEVLAWLLDREGAFSARFAALFVRKDPEALAAIDDVVRFGVETQIRLPPLTPEGNHLRPDCPSPPRISASASS
jgi:hypothetical protein